MDSFSKLSMPLPFERLKELNTKDCLWIYILKILQNKDSHAYTIRQEIQERFGFRPGIMTAYKVLYLLHKDGFVTQSPTGRKKIYSITPKGQKELKKAVGFYEQLGKTLVS